MQGKYNNRHKKHSSSNIKYFNHKNNKDKKKYIPETKQETSTRNVSLTNGHRLLITKLEDKTLSVCKQKRNEKGEFYTYENDKVMTFDISYQSYLEMYEGNK